MRVILLAAGRGRRFGKRTARLPKCLIPIGPGKDLLSRYLSSFRALGLHDVNIVVGHEKEKIVRECATKGRGLSIRFIENPDYTLGSLLSLYTASGLMDGDCLIMDADVYFPTVALRRLVRSKHSSAFLIDPRSRSTGEEMMVMAKNSRAVRIAKKIVPSLDILGESVGFLKLGEKDAPLLKKILRDFVRRGKTGVEYEDSYNALMKKRKLGTETIREFWTEMDFEEDLRVIHKKQKA